MSDWDVPRDEGPDHLFAVLEDLEARAGALHGRERRAEVEDRARSAYAEVTLAGRLMASVGREITVEVRGAGRLTGILDRVATGWFRLGAGASLHSVRTPAVTTVRGASERAVPAEAWSPIDTLGYASVLRRLADEQEACSVHLVDGARHHGRVARVGADFFELVAGSGVVDLVAVDAVAAIRATA